MQVTDDKVSIGRNVSEWKPEKTKVRREKRRLQQLIAEKQRQSHGRRTRRFEEIEEEYKGYFENLEHAAKNDD